MLLKRFFLLVFLWGVAGMSFLFAQGQLQRISITERSDGNGYVIRYHLTEMVNSYDLRQPETNRIQMQLFSTDLTTAGIQLPELNEEITDVDLIPIDGGVGVDIVTREDLFFKAAAYPDQNQRDLLLAIEYSTPSESEQIASETNPYEWSAADMDTQPVAEETETVEEPQRQAGREDRFIQRKNTRVGVSFGFAAGIGIANKIGGGYNSDPRQELAMGVLAAIDLPFVILSLDTGIETGIFYTQKGFKNPSGRINAQTVVLDYMEIPVLGKLSYNLTEITEPYLLGGGYIGFRTAAETVQADGDRNDLDDVTNSVDFGGVAGIGSDFNFDMATVSLQVRYEVGFPRLFDQEFSGRERPGYLSVLLGFRF